MADLLCSGKTIMVDKESFMTNYEEWDDSVAGIIAKCEKILLTI